MKRLAALMVVVAGLAAGPAAAAPEPRFRVLAFSHTEGFRHDSIAAGTAALRELGKAHGFAVRSTENAGAFRRPNLRRFDAVVFLNTTGDVLGARGQAALERFIAAGGGWLGVHSAADTEYEWPWYGGLVGAYFKSHPAGPQEATIAIEDDSHPATRGLPAAWTRTDEWYDFQRNPRADVHVLATLDESSYAGGTMGADHPIAWCQRYRGGRSIYTAGGHTAEAYAEPSFRRHLLGAIRWAAGAAAGDCSAP